MNVTISHLLTLLTNVPNDQQVIKELANREGFELNKVTSLSGGSINAVYLLDTSEGKKVIKINSAGKFPNMFAAEKQGLEALKKAEAFDVPAVLGLGEIEDMAYLLLEHKKEGGQKNHFWEVFGEQLSELHKASAKEFGFSGPNYIGSLPQYNEKRKSTADFFISQRLEPQVKMASERGFSLGDLSGFYQNISEEITEEAPALLHGDLWSGNYITNEEGLPCLIDPAVCYGPREMDLAMMKLFGGFPSEVFEVYHAHFPLQQGWEERIPLWQLYYLLVHLNIFGSSYLPQVKGIIRRFS
ncbi:fructosamine kinase family protein [Salinimicrobium sediminilitoris]|uniref:fructosamine kinase family protein n=1 Tax=Salinimicrobium sediminilitoris TaxID=2876715 RepID=UPI001E4F84C7|nr:fructosamine kinase family protein [Salinimicrobium sediminilitoris]MCC8360015.1 fructosamine kinase family protein [Salinimicrobium sediminilitoris]